MTIKEPIKPPLQIDEHGLVAFVSFETELEKSTARDLRVLELEAAIKAAIKPLREERIKVEKDRSLSPEGRAQRLAELRAGAAQRIGKSMQTVTQRVEAALHRFKPVDRPILLGVLLDEVAGNGSPESLGNSLAGRDLAFKLHETRNFLISQASGEFIGSDLIRSIEAGDGLLAVAADGLPAPLHAAVLRRGRIDEQRWKAARIAFRRAIKDADAEQAFAVGTVARRALDIFQNGIAAIKGTTGSISATDLAASDTLSRKLLATLDSAGV